jgi:hypothetical protein
MEAGSDPSLEAVRDTDTPGRHTGSAIIGAMPPMFHPADAPGHDPPRRHRTRNSMPNDMSSMPRSAQGSLETLSQREVQQLSEAGSGSVYTLFRQCALAILNTGAHVDNAKTILDAYRDFEVRIHQQDRGVRLELLNAPADAFVDGEMIASTREMLFSALRDIVYTETNWTASAST